MRNVKRAPEPESLRRNANRWKRELLSAVRREKKTREKVPEELFSRYRQSDVRDILKEMYRDLCCYCEARIGVVAYEQIEHRKPKRRFPKYTFAWDNLHLICPRCNVAKGDQWNDEAPILDAVKDRPIEEHLTYKVSESGIRRWPRSSRGDTTVCHTDLDRDDLLHARTKVYLATMGTIQTIREVQKARPELPQVKAGIRELRAKSQGEFGSLIGWVIDEERLEPHDSTT